MLQFSILGLKTEELYLPTKLHKIIVNLINHLKIVISIPEKSTVPVNIYIVQRYYFIKSGGIEMCGLKLSLTPRSQQSQAAPKLEKYSFVSYSADKISSP